MLFQESGENKVKILSVFYNNLKQFTDFVFNKKMAEHIKELMA